VIGAPSAPAPSEPATVRGLQLPSAMSRTPTRKALFVAVLWAFSTACAEIEVVSNIAYDDRFGAATTMDVYLPADGAVDRPAVMMIHGGSWRYLDKDIYARQAVRLARAGYVTASINYRLTPDGVYPGLIQDSVCALALLRARADEWGLDPTRVAVAGYSAGGHLAALLGTAIDEPDFQPDCAAGPTGPPAAVVSGAAPHDLRPLAGAGAVQALIGGTLAEYPERYERASPMARVRPGAPPFLLIHGTADLFVPSSQSEDMRDALVAAGGEARLLTLDAGGHLLNPGADVGQLDGVTSADVPEAWAASIDFLDRTIGAHR
jgi:acetyl esterase/lipase